MEIINKLSESNLDLDIIIGILNGYEGCAENWEDFTIDFYGRDVLLKAAMVFNGQYSSWDKALYKNSANAKKLAAFLQENNF